MRRAGGFARCALVALLAGLALAPARLGAAEPERSVLRVAITTSFEDSGLAEHLLPPWERASGLAVKLYVVGSGQALRLARIGEVDVTITHAPADEQAFLAEGRGASQRLVMSNDYVLVGPGADPAGVRNAGDVLVAMQRIAGARARFASRGDDSGTHKLERSLWRASGVDPLGQSWYEEFGLGMGDTLHAADAGHSYTLVDRATWLANRASTTLTVLQRGDERLRNRYLAIAVHHDKSAGDAATAFVDWLGSAQARGIIAAMRVDGEPLFDLPDGA